MRVAFRVDSSAAIGNGHLMRCLTLAKALTQQGAQCQFVCRSMSGSLHPLVNHAGYPCHVLTHHDEALTDGKVFSAATQCMDAQQFNHAVGTVDWVVVDHYRLDHHWHDGMSSRRLIIDDLSNRAYRGEIVVDQTYQKRADDYVPWVNQEATVLAGENYALLANVFCELRSFAKQRRCTVQAPKKLLVSLGGTDPNNTTCEVLQVLSSIRVNHGVAVTVVLASNAPHVAKVQALVSTLNIPITLLSGLDAAEMAQLIVEHDLAVGAAGVSALERCTLGLPTLTVTTADNQASVALNMAAQGAIMYLGDIKTLSQDDFAKRFTASYTAIMSDTLAYQRAIENAFSVCDGGGTERVVRAMQAMNHTKFQAMNHPTAAHE